MPTSLVPRLQKSRPSSARPAHEPRPRPRSRPRFFVPALALIALWCAGCATHHQSHSNANLLPALQPYVSEVAGEVGTLSPERKQVLNAIANDITGRLKDG